VTTAEREVLAIDQELVVELPVAVTSTGQSGRAVVRLLHSIEGVSAQDATVDLVAGQSRTVTLRLALRWRPFGEQLTAEIARTHLQPQSPDAAPLPMVVEVAGDGIAAQVPVGLRLLPAGWSGAANCDEQLPSYVSADVDFSYEPGGVGRCRLELGTRVSGDPFRKAGVFDWQLALGSQVLISRSRWQYLGGDTHTNIGRAYRVQCSTELSRAQYVCGLLGQDPLRLEFEERK
jgi:hypothetical protein